MNIDNFNNNVNNDVNNNNSLNTMNQSIMDNNSSVKVKKKNKSLILIGIIGIIAVSVVIIIVVLINFVVNDNPNKDNNNGQDVKVIYVDDTRNLKNSYTFDEAISKFAFYLEEEYRMSLSKTFMFESNEHIKLNDFFLDSFKLKYIDSNGLLDDNLIEVFPYENYNNIEDYAKDMEESYCDSDIKIYNQDSEYFYGFCKRGSDNVYHYDVVINESVFSFIYSYNNYLTPDFNKNNDEVLGMLKSAASCFSVDDGNEPFIYDKLVNVPLMMNMKIKDAKLIKEVTDTDELVYTFSGVIFEEFFGDKLYNFSIDYKGSNVQNVLDSEWSTLDNSNIKYVFDASQNFYTIAENNNKQVFSILVDGEKFDSLREFNEVTSKFLINN